MTVYLFVLGFYKMPRVKKTSGLLNRVRQTQTETGLRDHSQNPWRKGQTTIN